ncbi:MAG: MotA/TolQ/ExbB proton channel family protein [Marinilabiliales bacterium]|nr:MotA/TolQ/ExbB proton channel family protein [Marinilabiliales bacterium]
MSKNSGSFKRVFESLFATIAIVVAFLFAWFLYENVMGSPVNFEGGNPKGAALPGNYMGIVYKGGPIVPILMTCVLTLVIFVIERFLTLTKVKGKGSLDGFVADIQTLTAKDKIEDAIKACDVQKGSLANVVKAGLLRYRDLEKDQTLEKDQKITSMKQALEEASALELPMLSKNMVILSTLASISVLIGLIGTVLGMIRAFAALAQAGAPDALALATGISEALINTAFGITGSTLAIVFYNFFSSKIDGYTFKIDEAGFSLTQTFAASIRK